MFLRTGILNGQELPVHAQHQLENEASITGMEIHPDQGYLNDLLYYKKHPLSINKVDAEELQGLHLLTKKQIADFIIYRQLAGKLIDIYELQSIPGWDPITISQILPYVQVSTDISVKENFFKRLEGGDRTIKMELSQILEKARGYDTSFSNHYLGSPQHILLNYTYKNKDLLQYGVLGEKDPGEQFFKGAQSHGFDFYSFHLFLRKLSNIKALVIGDFNVDLGQGLIQWQTLSFGSGSDVSAIEKQSPILSPYRSAGEFNFNRGIGITLNYNCWEATAFSSYKKFSGRIVNDTTDIFTSFLTSGLNRTPSEISNRNVISLFSFGGNVTYKYDRLKMGVNVADYEFSIPLKKANKPYNYYFFSGTKLINFSTDYSYAYKNFRLFGEFALDKKFHKAVIQGLLLSLDRKADFSILYKNIEKEYESVFGRTFTSTTFPVNEKGVNLGMDFKPDPSLIINASVDFFNYPWLKYRIDAPSRGCTYNVAFHYQPDKLFTLYLNYRNKNTPANISFPDSVTNLVFHEINKSLLVQLSAKLHSLFTLKNSFQVNWMFNRQKGFLTYLEGSYHYSKKLEGSVRLQYFETALDNVLYTFEASALNYFSTPSSSGNGIHYFITASYSIKERVTLYVNWSQTVYKDKSKIGYGSEIINGNKRSELSFQIKYEW